MACIKKTYDRTNQYSMQNVDDQKEIKIKHKLITIIHALNKEQKIVCEVYERNNN